MKSSCPAVSTEHKFGIVSGMTAPSQGSRLVGTLCVSPLRGALGRSVGREVGGHPAEAALSHERVLPCCSHKFGIVWRMTAPSQRFGLVGIPCVSQVLPTPHQPLQDPQTSSPLSLCRQLLLSGGLTCNLGLSPLPEAACGQAGVAAPLQPLSHAGGAPAAGEEAPGQAAGLRGDPGEEE